LKRSWPKTCSMGSGDLSMADYEIGYGGPPRHSQFKKGVSANPRGRPRRFNPEIGDVVYSFLSAKAQYREKGQTKQTSRLELAIKHHINAALNGNVASTIMLLKMRAHGLKFGDTGPLIIRIVNALPPMRHEVEGQEEPCAQDAGRSGVFR
jgi:hypothetical protein